MSDQKVKFVVTATLNKENMADLPSYLEQIGPLSAKFGAQPVVKYKTIAQLSGEQSPDLISIMEFPNAEVIKEMINSKEFTDMATLRERVFSKLNLMICE